MTERPCAAVSTERSRRDLAEDLIELPELFTKKLGQVVVVDEPGQEFDRVGIVFVHGVGSQRKGDTLREFGTPLVDWVEEWHRDRGLLSEYRVTWSDVVPQGSDPAAAAMIIPPWTETVTTSPEAKMPHGGQVWIMTEAHWAAKVEPPALSTMVGWATKRIARLMAGLFRGALASAVRRPLRPWGHLQWAERFFQVTNALTIIVLYGAVQVLLYVVLLLLAVVSLIPIPGLDDFIFIRLARPLLTNNVGDFYVCMYDRLQATDVRQSVLEAVSWLIRNKCCDRILVAAHSGGTVVAADALGTHDLGGLGASRHSLLRQLDQVKTLITFGAALNAAWEESGDENEYKPARDIPRQLLRPGTAWLNFWTYFDWATSGKALDHGPAGQGHPLFSFPVTNGLSPVADHGGYFTNFEEFIARLAQEADRPSSPRNGNEYQQSRFWPGEAVEGERIIKRYARVAMLTWWRFAAIVAVPVALVGRYVLGSRDAVADATTIKDLIPFIGGLSTGLAHSPLAWVILTLATLALTGIAYLLWVALFFNAWHKRIARQSAQRSRQERADEAVQHQEILERTEWFLSFLAVVILAFSLAPAFADIRAGLALFR